MQPSAAPVDAFANRPHGLSLRAFPDATGGGPASAAVTLSVHGHGVDVRCDVPAVTRSLLALLDEWIVRGDTTPSLEGAVEGRIDPYDIDTLVRHLSPAAKPFHDPDLAGPWLELYQDEERFWLVDERWGLCEIDLLRRSWRSWILPEPTCDPVRLLEAAVIWPMAQLLRSQGLYLLPAASIGRAGKGVLILSPFNIAPELAALGAAGVGVLGQRWSALRPNPDGSVEILRVPGRMEIRSGPRMRGTVGDNLPQWQDLSGIQSEAAADCRLVLVVEPGRRAMISSETLTKPAGREAVRAVWSMPELRPSGVTPKMPAHLAEGCGVHRVCLSRDGRDLARLLGRPVNRAA